MPAYTSVPASPALQARNPLSWVYLPLPINIEPRKVGGGLTLCHETVHHPLHQLDLVLDRKVDKVRVDEYPEWRA
jgi:hypothetical protein